MMQPKEHANLLSIFFWVFAVLQSLVTILWISIVGFVGYAAANVPRQNRSDADEATTVFTVMLLIFGGIALIALACTMINIFAGIGLRRQKSWAKTLALTASITSVISSIFMGFWAFPVGLALGIYGLWFVLSDDGKRFFSNEMLMNENQMLLNQSVYTGQTYQYYNPNNTNYYTPNYNPNNTDNYTPNNHNWQ